VSSYRIVGLNDVIVFSRVATPEHLKATHLSPDFEVPLFICNCFSGLILPRKQFTYAYLFLKDKEEGIDCSMPSCHRKGVLRSLGQGSGKWEAK
jgi:hypothetical protein